MSLLDTIHLGRLSQQLAVIQSRQLLPFSRILPHHSVNLQAHLQVQVRRLRRLFGDLQVGQVEVLATLLHHYHLSLRTLRARVSPTLPLALVV